MGKIYFNLNNEKINYLEENMVTPYDMLLSDMSKKIILVSMNNVKEFNCFDPWRENEEVIKNLIKSGYKPVNKFMELLITQNYSFCPNCGADIDIERDSNILISDAGKHLANLVNKNINPAKELSCLDCGHQGLFYYDLYSDTEEKNAFAQRAVESGAEIYVRYRYILDGGSKNAWIPVIFDFSQFMQFFNAADESNNESDMVTEINKGDDKKMIKMLFNKELQRVLQNEENKLVDNMRVDLKPIELGSYSKYVTKKDFETIQLYKSIGDDQEKLLQLILG